MAIENGPPPRVFVTILVYEKDPNDEGYDSEKKYTMIADYNRFSTWKLVPKQEDIVTLVMKKNNLSLDKLVLAGTLEISPMFIAAVAKDYAIINHS